MTQDTRIDPAAVKARSEQIIQQSGGRICDWLPSHDQGTMRSQAEVIGRALVLNALLNIHFQAPIPIIRGWIEANGLSDHLSRAERALLQKQNADLTEQEDIDLYWYIEALWALLWVGGLIPDMPFDQPVGDHMAALVPNLQRGENSDKFARMRLRPYGELFQMLDLYYRVHWYARDGQLNGYSTGDISLDVVMERRKALEWVWDASSDWDNMRLDT
jgi:hypothetical protein